MLYKYDVLVKFSFLRTFQVEANTREEAEELAITKACSSRQTDKMHVIPVAIAENPQYIRDTEEGEYYHDHNYIPEGTEGTSPITGEKGCDSMGRPLAWHVMPYQSMGDYGLEDIACLCENKGGCCGDEPNE